MKIEKEKERIKKLIDQYFKELAYLHSLFEIFFQLRYGDKEWNKIYKISPVFFNVIIKALLSESILVLCKFIEGIDNNERSKLNLNSFLKRLKHNQEIFKDLPDEERKHLNESFENFEEKLKSYKPVIKNLLKWRDKFIAHFDVMDTSIITNKAKISAEEIREIISFIAETLNYYYYKLEKGTIIHYKYIGYNDLQRLMAFAIKGIDANSKTDNYFMSNDHVSIMKKETK